jgi:hypothetical protein
VVSNASLTETKAAYRNETTSLNYKKNAAYRVSDVIPTIATRSATVDMAVKWRLI